MICCIMQRYKKIQTLFHYRRCANIKRNPDTGVVKAFCPVTSAVRQAAKGAWFAPEQYPP